MDRFDIEVKDTEYGGNCAFLVHKSNGKYIRFSDCQQRITELEAEREAISTLRALVGRVEDLVEKNKNQRGMLVGERRFSERLCNDLRNHITKLEEENTTLRAELNEAITSVNTLVHGICSLPPLVAIADALDSEVTKALAFLAKHREKLDA